MRQRIQFQEMNKFYLSIRTNIKSVYECEGQRVRDSIHKIAFKKNCYKMFTQMNLRSLFMIAI